MEMQYLYNDDDAYHFMENDTFEQVPVPREQIGDSAEFLKEETIVNVMFFKGKAIDIELPNFVVLKITDTVGLASPKSAHRPRRERLPRRGW